MFNLESMISKTKLNLFTFLFVLVLILLNNVKAQSVSVNITGNPADSSAILDVQSTTKGLLIPKMTEAQRNAITSPANGLLIFQTDGQMGIYFNQGTAVTPNWQYMQTGAATYRWCLFDTYDQAYWATSNNPAFFGGINPSTWTDGNGIASNMSSDKEVLRTLFNKKGYAKANSNILNETYISYSSTNGKVVGALFRVKNLTASPINWTPSFYYSAYSPWGETASVALNGVSAWTSGATSTDNYTPSTTVVLSIPANRTSTVIVMSPSSVAQYGGGSTNVRCCRLIFNLNSLTLPAGLVFMDDLDNAGGGWEQ